MRPPEKVAHEKQINTLKTNIEIEWPRIRKIQMQSHSMETKKHREKM
jgi:hypothetical protein